MNAFFEFRFGKKRNDCFRMNYPLAIFDNFLDDDKEEEDAEEDESAVILMPYFV